MPSRRLSLLLISLPPTTMTDTSSAQLVANRENGKRGGVKTANGKAAVRFNARTHSILATLLTKYEEKELEGYLQQLYDFYDPQTYMECVLVERIAAYYLRLHRVGKAEGEFMQMKLDPHVTRPFLADLELDTVVKEGYKPTIMPEDVEHLARTYLRYKVTLENRLYKAMHELERLQRMTKGEDVHAPMVLDVQHENGFVSQNDQ